MLPDRCQGRENSADQRVPRRNGERSQSSVHPAHKRGRLAHRRSPPPAYSPRRFRSASRPLGCRSRRIPRSHQSRTYARRTSRLPPDKLHLRTHPYRRYRRSPRSRPARRCDRNTSVRKFARLLRSSSGRSRASAGEGNAPSSRLLHTQSLKKGRPRPGSEEQPPKHENRPQSGHQW